MAIDIKRHVEVSVDSFERKVPHALIRVFASDSDGFPSYQVGKKIGGPAGRCPYMPIGCESGEAPDLMILAGSGVFKRCGVLRATLRLCQFLLCIAYFSPVVALWIPLEIKRGWKIPEANSVLGKSTD
jgi:hypothetical protein